MPDQTFDPTAYCVYPGERRLNDEEIRRVAEVPGTWSPPLAREVLALRARLAELDGFVRGLAINGLSCDLTPTLSGATPEAVYAQFSVYLDGVDRSIRESARELLREVESRG